MKSELFTLKEYLKVSYVSVVFIQTCLAVTCTVIALSHDDDDCEPSIRPLILANTVILSFSFFLSLWFRRVGFAIWFSWNVVFLVLAVCWTFANRDCEDDFAFGYAVTTVMGVVSMIMVCMILSGLCIGGIALCIGYGLMDKYENIE